MTGEPTDSVIESVHDQCEIEVESLQPKSELHEEITAIRQGQINRNIHDNEYQTQVAAHAGTVVTPGTASESSELAEEVS